MCSNNKYSLILASKSPRRKELLDWTELPFEIHTVSLEEQSDLSNPKEIVEDIASQKGRAVFENLKLNETIVNPLVIASDTIVTRNGIIYGKPRDREHAKKMLMELSGKEHEVMSAVYYGFYDLSSKELIEYCFSCTTQVQFTDITLDCLEQYLDSGESLDKAGSYGIQGKGIVFVSGISGSYSNVVGFPVAEFLFNLKKLLGYQDDNSGKWRELFR